MAVALKVNKVASKFTPPWQPATGMELVKSKNSKKKNRGRDDEYRGKASEKCTKKS